jgi:hypothetical protein
VFQKIEITINISENKVQYPEQSLLEETKRLNPADFKTGILTGCPAEDGTGFRFLQNYFIKSVFQ